VSAAEGAAFADLEEPEPLAEVNEEELESPSGELPGDEPPGEVAVEERCDLLTAEETPKDRGITIW
jgi:hypothetical protein